MSLDPRILSIVTDLLANRCTKISVRIFADARPKRGNAPSTGVARPDDGRQL